MFKKILIPLALNLSLSCATYPKPAAPGGDAQPYPDYEYSRAVHFSVTCGPDRWTGSGVIYANDVVYTAKHVVDCDDDLQITVTLSDNSEHSGRVLHKSSGLDFASVQISEGPKMSALEIGPMPPLDERLCFTPKSPDDYRACGYVQRKNLNEDGLISFSAVTQFGNSGSGVYDSKGRLVGVISTLRRCGSIPQVCGGGVVFIGGLHE